MYSRPYESAGFVVTRAVTLRSTPMVAPGETGHVHGVEGGACGPLWTQSEDLGLSWLSWLQCAPLAQPSLQLASV